MTYQELKNAFIELHEEGKIPTGSYVINAETFSDIRLTIKTHLNVLKGCSSSRIKRPYRLRLEKLLKQLTR
jgi:hypothetical protein